MPHAAAMEASRLGSAGDRVPVMKEEAYALSPQRRIADDSQSFAHLAGGREVSACALARQRSSPGRGVISSFATPRSRDRSVEAWRCTGVVARRASALHDTRRRPFPPRRHRRSRQGAPLLLSRPAIAEETPGHSVRAGSSVGVTKTQCPFATAETRPRALDETAALNRQPPNRCAQRNPSANKHVPLKKRPVEDVG